MCLFGRLADASLLDANAIQTLHSWRSYIAPQIHSEVKEIQLFEKMSFNETKLPVIMRLFVC
jgi:hypothetical protein